VKLMVVTHFNTILPQTPILLSGLSARGFMIKTV